MCASERASEWLHDSLHLHNNMYSSLDLFVGFGECFFYRNSNDDKTNERTHTHTDTNDDRQRHGATRKIEKWNETKRNCLHLDGSTIRKQMYLYAQRGSCGLLHFICFAPSPHIGGDRLTLVSFWNKNPSIYRSPCICECGRESARAHVLNERGRWTAPPKKMSNDVLINIT